MYVATLPEFVKEAERFTKTLAPRETGATLVTLSGDLGAGKTTFVKTAALTLGVEEVVNSPTFVLEKIYSLPHSAPFERLAHIDAYRLEKGSDLAPLGFDELMHDSSTLVMLEWPEKVEDALPSPAAAISLAVSQEGRTITYGAQT